MSLTSSRSAEEVKACPLFASKFLRYFQQGKNEADVVSAPQIQVQGNHLEISAVHHKMHSATISKEMKVKELLRQTSYFSSAVNITSMSSQEVTTPRWMG
eukprot:TRINITY_DN9533_c0_g1_i1.p1 TRINITY_DN9533_c0_g1~~TRINITY_DN9533_c0_g1_i1.p1  ORF type:complete len:100 (-),score=11.88 TRINITY_DN9533_c0_g1_i1:269-568(-)